MSRFLSPTLSAVTPYTPGEQPQDQQYIKLNTNESPYLPSPAVVAAVSEAEVEKLRLYSDPACADLLRAAAAHFGLQPDQIMPGNGSDENLFFALRAFCDEQHPLAYADITYGCYGVWCGLLHIPSHIIPLKDDFTLDPKDYDGLHQTIVIANPNAPTGLALPRSAIEGILQAKLEIFRGVPKNGVGVFNGDEPLLWNVRADGGHKKYYFGIENHACDVLATDIQELEDGMRFVVSGFGHRFELFVPVLGRHTVYNALAAVTAALLLKIPPETIQAQISGFQNTGMRQKIYERDGFTIIEDCYNAGPESTEAALDILAGFRARAKGRCIAVLGDMLELGNRSAAEHYRIGRIAAAKVDMLYTYGTNSERMVSGAITGGMKQKFVEHFDTHEDLAHMLKMRARPGDVILFKGSRGMRMEKALALFFKEEEE